MNLTQSEKTALREVLRRAEISIVKDEIENKDELYAVIEKVKAEMSFTGFVDAFGNKLYNNSKIKGFGFNAVITWSDEDNDYIVKSEKGQGYATQQYLNHFELIN